MLAPLYVLVCLDWLVCVVNELSRRTLLFRLFLSSPSACVSFNLINLISTSPSQHLAPGYLECCVWCER